MRSYCAGSGRVISGGSSTSRRAAVELLGEAGEGAVAGALAGAGRGVLDLRRAAPRRRRRGAAGRGRAGRRRGRAAAARRGATGARGRSATQRRDGVPALLLGGAVLPAGDVDAGDQPAQVPLPGARVRLVEVVEVEDEIALRRGVEAEVAQVGVTADHRGDAGGRQRGEVRGHDRRGAAQEGERARDHPPDPHRDQPLHPALVARDHRLHGVGAAAVSDPSRPALERGTRCRSCRPDLVALDTGGGGVPQRRESRRVGRRRAPCAVGRCPVPALSAMSVSVQSERLRRSSGSPV